MDFDGPESWYEKVYFDDVIFVGQQDPDHVRGSLRIRCGVATQQVKSPLLRVEA